MKTRTIAAAGLAILASGAAIADGAAPFSTISAGAEFPYLSLNSNHGGGGEGSGGNAWFDDGFDDRVAYRLTASTNLIEEFGARVRYFNYDAGTGSDGGPDPSLFFETWLLDIEGTASMKLGKWDIVASAGARGGNIEWSDEDGGDGYEFDGWGFTTALDARRAFDNGLAIVASVRHSQLFGDIEEIATPTDSISNNVVPVTEFRAGIEYAHPVFPGGLVTVGVHYEATLISSLSGNVDGDIDPEDTDIGLMGPAASIKLTIDPSKL
jgi:opacity protein-like surface antigen